jgi:hypothetical protein
MTTTTPSNDTTPAREYVSVTEAARRIRAGLKKLGFTSRDVSVKSESFSLGSALRVKIKNPAIQISKVKEIANSFERIYRDESGEILGGCNRYLDVEYSDFVLEFMALPLLAALPEDGSVVGFGPYRVMKNQNERHDHYYRAVNPSDDNDRDTVCWGRETIARSLVIRMLDRGEVWSVAS